MVVCEIGIKTHDKYYSKRFAVGKVDIFPLLGTRFGFQ